jgi:hypothetical protein
MISCSALPVPQCASGAGPGDRGFGRNIHELRTCDEQDSEFLYVYCAAIGRATGERKSWQGY